MNKKSIAELERAHEAQTIHLDIPGKPLGKSRPRVTRRGITYTPKSTAKREKFIRMLFANAYHHSAPLACPLEAVITAVYPIPKSVTKTRRADMMAGRISPVIRPDVDNVAKLVLDALNTIAYVDDSQIVKLIISKRYTYENELPHTLIELHPLAPAGKQT